MLREFLELWKAHHEAIRRAAEKEVWYDPETTRNMLKVGDRMLNNYVRSGKLVSKKIGKANLYLESSILSLINKK